MKTLQETMKSLRIHTLSPRSGCVRCAYRNGSKIPGNCTTQLLKDTMLHIKHLVQDNAQKDERIRMLEREKEAAINAIKFHRFCFDCKHSKIIPDGDGFWVDCPKRDGRCCGKNLWEWRGVEEKHD